MKYHPQVCKAFWQRDEVVRDPLRTGNLAVALKGISETRVLPRTSPRQDQARQGKHFVIARLHFENVGSYSNCTKFTAELRAGFGERIMPYLVARFWEDELNGLAPGKTIDGDYAFPVKDDAKVSALVLAPGRTGEASCRDRFDPPIPKVDAKTIEIPLNHESGKAVCIHVIKSLVLRLDQKAIEAVEKWKFKPGMKDGKPVPVMATIEVPFRLL